jgi:hypothetical protein
MVNRDCTDKPLNIFQGGAPQLQQLHTIDFVIDLPANCSVALTSLTIRYGTAYAAQPVHLSLDRLMAFLSGLPSLADFNLNCHTLPPESMIIACISFYDDNGQSPEMPYQGVRATQQCHVCCLCATILRLPSFEGIGFRI